VQPTDAEGAPMFVMDDIRARWDDVWKQQDAAFVAECDANPAFVSLKDRMFSVFDGNHQLYSWLKISQEHPDVLKYHPRIHCVIFRGKKDAMIELKQAMHSVNK